MHGTVAEVDAEGQRATAGLHVRLGRLLCSFPTLLVAILFAKVYWTCRTNIADPDLWWHLRNAQYLLTNLHFPNVDTYSFTAAGSPWVNHEWLSELFYYGAFRLWGLRGIFIVFASVLAVLVVAVFRLSLKQAQDPLAAATAAIFGGLLAGVGFTPRTQHFGWLCFLGIYAILLSFRSRRHAPLWLIPVLFCLWINCHASWLIGMAVYSIFVCVGFVRRDIGRLEAAPWSSHEAKQLVVTGLASVALLFVNPFGYRLIAYPFDMLFRQKVNVGNVEEWASVNFNDPRGTLVAVVLAAVFLMALVGKKRWRIDDVLLTLFVLYCGLSHMRFLFLAGIVLPPILAPQLGRISSHDPQRERRILQFRVAGGRYWLVRVRLSLRTYARRRNLRLLSRRCDALSSRDPQPGHMFNLYEWGGYLEWNLPQAPTFIDSRTDIFEYNGVLKDYLNVVKLSHSQEILDRHGVTYVLFLAGPALPYFLSKSSQWECIYGDSQAVIYRRLRN